MQKNSFSNNDEHVARQMSGKMQTTKIEMTKVFFPLHKQRSRLQQSSFHLHGKVFLEKIAMTVKLKQASWSDVAA